MVAKRRTAVGEQRTAEGGQRTAEPLTTRDLNRALLSRQMLLAREKATVTEAVHRLIAMQAQVARPPFVGLWTRLSPFTRADLLKALHARTIVRATSLRGTIHVMAADDFVGLRGALQPALTRGLEAILGDRIKDVDYAALDQEARAFFHGQSATFDALRKHLKAKNAKTDERALAYAIRVTLPLVQVPTDDRWGFPASADFAIADTWLKRKISYTPIKIAKATAGSLVNAANRKRNNDMNRCRAWPSSR